MVGMGSKDIAVSRCGQSVVTELSREQFLLDMARHVLEAKSNPSFQFLSAAVRSLLFREYPITVSHSFVIRMQAARFHHVFFSTKHI
jgi:hypothetical protein